MAAVALRSTLQRIGWSNAAQAAFTDEGFGDIEEIGLVTAGIFSHKLAKRYVPVALRLPQQAEMQQFRPYFRSQSQL